MEFNSAFKGLNVASRACVRRHRWYISRNIGTSVVLENLHFDEDVAEERGAESHGRFLHIAFHIHDSVRNDNMGKPFL
jgi:hypothetical protein